MIYVLQSAKSTIIDLTKQSFNFGGLKMTLNYNELKKEFFKKQKQLDKKETAKKVAAAFNIVRAKRALK